MYSLNKYTFKRPFLTPKTLHDRESLPQSSSGSFLNQRSNAFDFRAQSNSLSTLQSQLPQAEHKRKWRCGPPQDANGYKNLKRDSHSRQGHGPGPGRPPTDWTDSRSRALVRLVLDSDLPLTAIANVLKDGGFHPCKTSCRNQFMKLTGFPPDNWRLHDPKKKEARRAQMIQAMDKCLSGETPAADSLPSGTFPAAPFPQRETHSPYNMDLVTLAVPDSDLSSTTLAPSTSSLHQIVEAEMASADSAIFLSSPRVMTNDLRQNIPMGSNDSGMISNIESDRPTAFRKQHTRKISAPGDLEGAMAKHSRWPSKIVQARLVEFIKKRLSNSRSSVISAVSSNGSAISRWSNRRKSSQRHADRQSTRTSTGMYEINDAPSGIYSNINIAVTIEDCLGDSYDEVTELLTTLLENGGNVHDRTPKGETALHIAAGDGNISACQLLLRYGANVYARTDAGESISAYTKSKFRETADPARYAKIKCCRNMIKEHEMGKPLQIRSPPRRRKNALATPPTVQETGHEDSTIWTNAPLTSSPMSSISVKAGGVPSSAQTDASQAFPASWSTTSPGNMDYCISPTLDDNLFSGGAPIPAPLSFPPCFGSPSPRLRDHISPPSTFAKPPSIKTSFEPVQWVNGNNGGNAIANRGEGTYMMNQMQSTFINQETMGTSIAHANMDNLHGATSGYGMGLEDQASFEFNGPYTTSTTFENMPEGSNEQYDVLPAVATFRERYINRPTLAIDTQIDQNSLELSPRQLPQASDFPYPPTSARGRPVPPVYEGVQLTFRDPTIPSDSGALLPFEEMNINNGSWEGYGGQRWS